MLALHAVQGLQGGSWGVGAGAGSVHGVGLSFPLTIEMPLVKPQESSQDAGVNNWGGCSCRFSLFVPKIRALNWEKTKVLGIH